jgi:type I restriction enzyme S subunit
LIDTDNEYVINQRTEILSPKENFDSSFAYITLNGPFREKVRKIVQGGTQIYVNYPVVENLKLELPDLEEQKKIGTFFKHLEDTIALHQRKLTLLEQLKQTYLQALFPQNEKNIPALRFAGFSDPWEQRKVGEYLTESRIPGTDGSVAKKLTVKLWRKGVIPKEESYQGSAATNYFIRKSGQFIYGKLDFLNQAFGIVPYHLDGYESTLDSPAFDIFPTMNSIFFLEYVSRKEFYLYQGTLANGSRKAKRIHAETFFEMPINVPSNEEQNKIGNFLKQFDDTIALHQSNLQKFSELKKVLLSKMFV